MANFHRAPEAADGAVAVRRLEEALQRGKAQAATVVDHVLNCQPHDAIVKAAAMTFRPDGKRLLMEAGEARWSFHAHAFGQAASIVAPKGAEYLSMLRDGTDWQLSLLATNFNEWADLCDTFADPGGRSALRRAHKGNPRNRSCPSCKRRNVLTPADVARGYQCDRCADAAERGY